MKKYLLYAISALIALIAATLILASFQPKEWRIEKSIRINAPLAHVWSIVSDLNRYNDWNPFYIMEPQSKTEAKGPPATVGSTYSWDGDKSGAGWMTTTAVTPLERMDFSINFTRPMEAVSAGAFILAEKDGATQMVWEMSGRHEGFTGLIGRTIYLFVSMDSTLGTTFNSGLALLKEISERPVQ